MTPISFSLTTFDSPIGEMMLGTTDKGICLVDFKEGSRGHEHLKKLIQIFGNVPVEKNHPHLSRLKEQLSDYFQGKQTVFDLPLDPRGTLFRLKVWQSLLKIPCLSGCHLMNYFCSSFSVRATS